MSLADMQRPFAYEYGSCAWEYAEWGCQRWLSPLELSLCIVADELEYENERLRDRLWQLEQHYEDCCERH